MMEIRVLTLTMGGEFNDGRGHIAVALQRDYPGGNKLRTVR